MPLFQNLELPQIRPDFKGQWKSSEKEVVLIEKSVVFRGKNDSHSDFRSLRLDGGLLGSQDARKADFLLARKSPERAFIIELKGQDLGRAFTQIKSTLETDEIRKLIDGAPTDGVIVFKKNGAPNLTAQFRIAYEKLNRKGKLHFVKSNVPFPL